MPGLGLYQSASILNLTEDTLALLLVNQPGVCAALAIRLPVAIRRFCQLAGAAIESMRCDEVLFMHLLIIKRTGLWTGCFRAECRGDDSPWHTMSQGNLPLVGEHVARNGTHAVVDRQIAFLGELKAAAAKALCSS